MKLVVTVKVQWWKLRPCLLIIQGLYYIGFIDTDRAFDMAEKAVHNSVKIRAPKIV